MLILEQQRYRGFVHPLNYRFSAIQNPSLNNCDLTVSENKLNSGVAAALPM